MLMDLVAGLMQKYLDITVASEFGKALATILTIVLIIAILMLLVNLFQKLVFYIYTHSGNEKLQEAVTNIIYYLDHFADNMTNKQKRKEAISNVKELFIWRAIPIPSFIIGIIIDLEVASIRRLQKDAEKYKDPYLHEDDPDEEEAANDGSKDHK